MTYVVEPELSIPNRLLDSIFQAFPRYSIAENNVQYYSLILYLFIKICSETEHQWAPLTLRCFELADGADVGVIVTDGVIVKLEPVLDCP